MLYTVAILGSGNVATHLAKALYKNGVSITCVYSPTLANANKLAKETGSIGINDLDLLTPAADFYIIAVKDVAIAEINRQIDVKGMAVHTSGITPMSILARHADYGVFYPLQTFTKNIDADISKVPFLLEANTAGNFDLLKKLASLLSPNITYADSHQRQMVHLAAVFANNFTNYLYQVAFDILAKNNLPSDLLKPLIEETARKIQSHQPSEVQTGPARRNDIPTIEKHLTLLQSLPEYRQLYEILSTEIREKSEGK